ncbi:glutaredoxin domain-containing protein [Eionea flava]
MLTTLRSKNLGIFGAFLLLITISVSISAEVYKWVDEKGQVHYGDNPNEQEKKTAVNISSNESVTYSDAPDMSAKPSKGSPAQPSSKAKASGKKVTMYSTSWCGYCKKARKYFQSKGIPFVEYDIEKNASAKRDYDAIGGRGVPVIVVGKKRMSGFSQKGFDRFYNNL